ncbi:J domain-containing protein [Kribbella sp. CA-247076]|uniref:J domain-containing protein n=1 Tax=Kribbella sp. CA-247076 TaxID=3239941 RepID=UPI003D8FAAD1
MSTLPDPYVVLGVGADASGDELDRAFRGLVRRLHPDTRSYAEDATADRRLQELLAAYTTLRDPVRRAAYDCARTPPAPATARPVRPARAEPAIRVGPVRWKPLRT